MKISMVKLHCLNAICDDFEDIRSIAQDLASVTKSQVTELYAEQLLNQLVELGLANMYVYDIEKENYVKCDSYSDQNRNRRFLITKKGRSVLDENWDGPA